MQQQCFSPAEEKCMGLIRWVKLYIERSSSHLPLETRIFTKLFCYKSKEAPWQTHAICDKKQILPSGTEHTFSFQIYPKRIFIVLNNLIQVLSSLSACYLQRSSMYKLISLLYFAVFKIFREMIGES